MVDPLGRAVSAAAVADGLCAAPSDLCLSEVASSSAVCVVVVMVLLGHHGSATFGDVEGRGSRLSGPREVVAETIWGTIYDPPWDVSSSHLMAAFYGLPACFGSYHPVCRGRAMVVDHALSSVAAPCA